MAHDDLTGTQLCEVDADNVLAVCKLQLGDGQERLVAPAEYTVAELAYEPTESSLVRAICSGTEVVGVLAVVHDNYLVRLMIDRRYQRQGHGQRAVKLLAELLRERGQSTLTTSHVPSPPHPGKFYESLGFRYTGEVDQDGEPAMVLEF